MGRHRFGYKHVTVRGEADDDGGEGSKSGQSRVVPLNAEAQSVIEGWRRPALRD